MNIRSIRMLISCFLTHNIFCSERSRMNCNGNVWTSTDVIDQWQMVTGCSIQLLTTPCMWYDVWDMRSTWGVGADRGDISSTFYLRDYICASVHGLLIKISFGHGLSAKMFLSQFCVSAGGAGPLLAVIAISESTDQLWFIARTSICYFYVQKKSWSLANRGESLTLTERNFWYTKYYLWSYYKHKPDLTWVAWSSYFCPCCL